MKHTILILVTALMIAALDSGNVSPSLAETENDCLLLEISGASGRSVCEDTTFEGWTWTAPETGPVTFNTRGSDMTLGLTVYTFDPVYTEIAAAPDEVRFTAQEGTEYTIFASADDEASAGTIVLNWQTAPRTSCGNDSAALVGSSDETGLRETVFDDPNPGEPAYVLAGPNASIWYWTTDDAVTQSLYVYASTDGSVSVRTFHDADELPHKVVDECTGNWMLIQRYDAENVDFWFYDADDNYQSGLAVFEFEGSYYYAEIDGKPVHAGKRITGTLRPMGAPWTGSYTLDVDMSEIQDAQLVPEQLAALINGLSLDEAGSRDMTSGWRFRLATVLGPLGAWLSPEVAVAQPAVTIQDAVFVVGSVMLAVGTGGLAPAAYGAAGAVMVSVSYLLPDVSQEQIRSRCPNSPKMAHDLCHGVANNLARPDERGPVGFVSDLARDVRGTLSGAANRAKQALGNIGQFFNPSSSPQAMDEPIHRIPDDNPPETVSGTMTDRTTIVDVTGTVTPDGDFDVADDDGEVQLQMSIDGGALVEGRFEWDGVEGEVEVDPSDLEDWGADDEQTELDDLLAELEEAMREAEEAERLTRQEAELEEARREAEEAMRGAEEAERLTRQENETGRTETDDGQTELEAILAELAELKEAIREAKREKARRETEKANRANNNRRDRPSYNQIDPYGLNSRPDNSGGRRQRCFRADGTEFGCAIGR